MFSNIAIESYVCANVVCLFGKPASFNVVQAKQYYFQWISFVARRIGDECVSLAAVCMANAIRETTFREHGIWREYCELMMNKFFVMWMLLRSVCVFGLWAEKTIAEMTGLLSIGVKRSCFEIFCYSHWGFKSAEMLYNLNLAVNHWRQWLILKGNYESTHCIVEYKYVVS